MPVRLDYRVIEDHVAPGARVLDVGCGDGALLQELILQKDVEGQGIDIDVNQVLRCIARGVPVYHGDMLEGMSLFEDGRFDCVILSQTLQQIHHPERVLREMLRVGRRAIISFPNFGHWRVRLQLLWRGRMPVTRVLPAQWHDTPNIHMLTAKDFRAFCRDQGARIVDEVYISSSYKQSSSWLANLRAATAVFVVERAEDGQRP